MAIRDTLRSVISRSDGLYPLTTTNTRALPDDYTGPIITSDIDRTYLESSIHSIRGLVRTALETADQKRAFLGMVPLYRAFRHGPGDASRATPLYFVSASPPQMEEVLREKMAIDGIEVDGITLKDQIKLVFKGRWRELRKHIIYKLTALLLNRSTRPEDAVIDEVLIGDDSETDAEAYLLYTRIVEGAITPDGLGYILEGFGVDGKKRDVLMELASRRDKSRVKRIYIHCTTRRDPAALFAKDPRLISAMDSLQMALDAHQQGWIRREAIREVAWALGRDAAEATLSEAQARQIFDAAYLDEQRRYLDTTWADQPVEAAAADQAAQATEAANVEEASGAEEAAATDEGEVKVSSDDG